MTPKSSRDAPHRLSGVGKWITVSLTTVAALIGLVVNAVGLHRAGILNFFHALLLPIGVGGVISFLEYPPLEIASGVCVLVSVLPLGVRQLRAPDVTVPETRGLV